VKQILSLKARRIIVIVFDQIAIGVAFVGAFLLRFDFKIPDEMLSLMWRGLPWIYTIQSIVFISQGLYRGLWSFASLKDLFLILRAAAFSSILSVTVIAISWNHLIGWPRSVFILDGFLLILILGGGRFAYRYGREIRWGFRNKKKQFLIVGAGQSANLIARELSSRVEFSAKIIGFLDDRRQLVGSNIQGSPVLGTLETLDHWLTQNHPDEVIIAIPSLRGTRVKQILSACQKHNIPCRICPPVSDVLMGKVQLSQLREVRVEDLLRRDVVKVDDVALKDFFTGQRILVTGAGGSIGSELCRQILKFNPQTLILFDRSEYSLYRLESELRRENPSLFDQVQLIFVVGDILNEKRLQMVLNQYSPAVVLHAAAYKHVPLMEENIYEAIHNNVIGTYRLITAAAKAGVENFVMISTDKAVRPTSVMGATKRMAELIVNAVGKQSNIRTAAVRFGNVLDSEGSVLPLFREQIAKRGPVTVTHRDVTRFFMTIPEASQLVLQTGLLGRGGEVFLLDMGEPVLILELAEELIKLSGLRPYQDIDVVFTGLRKGEKLYEELLVDKNNAQQTSHPKIMVSTDEHTTGNLPRNWEIILDEFMKTSKIPDDRELLLWIKSWIPTYSKEESSFVEEESKIQVQVEQSNQLLH
jgi:FlaA1/EpsC-like NDP-sugar epimerase